VVIAVTICITRVIVSFIELPHFNLKVRALYPFATTVTGIGQACFEWCLSLAPL
jgi:hypothetical protein